MSNPRQTASLCDTMGDSTLVSMWRYGMARLYLCESGKKKIKEERQQGKARGSTLPVYSSGVFLQAHSLDAAGR